MQCSLCDASPSEIISTIDCKSRRNLNIYFCSSCGFVQQLPVPSPEELSAFYATEYRSEYKGTLRPKPKHVHRSAKSALRRASYLRSLGITGGSLLDIGAGSGEFVEICNRLGFSAEGLDPNQGYSDYARSEYGARVVTGEIGGASGSYDVVTMFHVLEHLPSPVDVFARLHHLVKPGGRLLIEVPWALSGSISPSNLYFKAHLHYFDAETLTAAASGHFRPVSSSTENNLLMLFEPLPVPGEIRLPREQYVADTRRKLDRHGWFHYIFRGGGLQVPIRKIRGIMDENRVRSHSGKAIIDDFAPSPR